MEQAIVSSEGRITIPKSILDALNLFEGATLMLEVRGQEIVLSKEPTWKQLRGAAQDPDLMNAFEAFKKQERERED